MMNAATARALREHLRYDSATGIFAVAKAYGPHSVGSIPGAKKVHGYRVISFDYIRYPEHHLAWFFTYGTLPKKTIDHINGIRDDNRIANLREVTFAENCRNRRLMKNNTTGVQGVYYFKRDGNWKACIRADGKNVHLGYFATKEEAMQARKKAERQFGYHELHGKVIG